MILTIITNQNDRHTHDHNVYQLSIVVAGRACEPTCLQVTKQNKISVALSPQANYTDRATANSLRNLVSTFVDRGVSRGQRGGSPTVVNLSFLDRSRYFSFK
jgi:hypothetical protein